MPLLETLIAHHLNILVWKVSKMQEYNSSDIHKNPRGHPLQRTKK